MSISPALRNTANESPGGYSWIQMVADTVARFSEVPDNLLQTAVQPCVIKGNPSVVYSKNLHETCSTLFHYLQNFAFCNDLKLVEDRRADRIEVTRERRQQWAPVIALGAGMMLRETTLNSAMIPSTPHELRSDESPLKAADVITLAAYVRAHGDYRELASNGMLIPSNSDNYAIAHYHCDMELQNNLRSVNYFEGKTFHALGYRSGDQVVLNVLVGGGPFNAPRLWGPVQRMARDPVQLHYLHGPGGRDGFGIFHAAYFLECED